MRRDDLHDPFEVFNQAPPLGDYNLFDTDAALKDAVEREWAEEHFVELSKIGAELGTAANFDAGRLANLYPPVLKTHDAQGNRIDRVEFHPAWHALMQGMIARGFHIEPLFQVEEGPDFPNAVRAAGYLMQAQIEEGSLCPVTMTYGAIPVLR